MVFTHLNVTNVLCLQWIEELQREILDDIVLVTAQFTLIILLHFDDICHAFSSITIYLHCGWGVYWTCSLICTCFVLFPSSSILVNLVTDAIYVWHFLSTYTPFNRLCRLLNPTLNESSNIRQLSDTDLSLNETGSESTPTDDFQHTRP